MTGLKKIDKQEIKKRRQNVSTYYQKENIMPMYVEEGDYITRIEKKGGGKILTKAPKEKLDKDYHNGKALVFDDETIPNIMVANIKKLRLDSVEAFILRQMPETQIRLRQIIKERRDNRKRINIDIVRNIRDRIEK